MEGEGHRDRVRGCRPGRQHGISVAASFESQQINRPHNAQASRRSQNRNVTINLESNGHTQPTQEPIPPDVSYGTLIFTSPPQPTTTHTQNIFTC